MTIVSADLGYGYVKVIASNGERAIFPSVVGDGVNNVDLTNTFGQRNNDINNMHLKMNNESYFIGELAEKESSSSTRIFEKERFSNNHTKILLNTAIQLVSDSDIVKIATGLPLDYYQSQSKSFRESILGIHPVTTWVSGPLAGQEKTINIDNALVLPQGATALFTALINHEGKFVYPHLMTEGNLIALIDIGFRTTDYIVVEIQSNGSFSPIAKLSGSVDAGVINLHNSLHQAFKSKTGGSDLNQRYIKQILKNGHLLFKGEKIDFKETIKFSKESIVSNISDRLKSIWSNEADLFGAIFLAGGGGELFQPDIQPYFDNRLQLIYESQFANAIGALRLSRATFAAKKGKKLG
ncbi:ParM/StbA family protein [Oceanobacillus jeddahense]|uniref:ParM/StbA family protein n=1 Tax=Oceanobacillus jeddahense TaxID=1462527 RepID=UPI000595E4BA|nr:ParM/StbA family protein [Oceanobacillus jeddahense]